jgi:hypothetical protein
METADPGASRAAKRVFARRPGHERDAAIGACVPKVRATRFFDLGTDRGSVARLGPNIRRAILRVRYDRRIAGRASGFDVFDDRTNVTRQQLLIIGSDNRVARFGPRCRHILRLTEAAKGPWPSGRRPWG